jgi:anti-anti-sigma regulatory factor
MSDLSELLGIASDHWPNGLVVMRLVGPLNATGSARLMDETNRLNLVGGDTLVIRLEDVTCVDPAGVGALAYAEAFARVRGGRFLLWSPRAEVRAALRAAGIDAESDTDEEWVTPGSSPASGAAPGGWPTAN